MTGEFIVYDTDYAGYISSFCTLDGDTDWDIRPEHARIFRGETWLEVFADTRRYDVIPYTEVAKCSSP